MFSNDLAITWRIVGDFGENKVNWSDDLRANMCWIRELIMG
jgi:hypothetical protein